MLSRSYGSLHTVSLINTAPKELMREIHDRMQVIVPRDDYGAWLDPANQEMEKLTEFIWSYPVRRMEA